MSDSQIFISHSWADQDWARKFAESLKEQGQRVWFDEWVVRPGDIWSETLESGLRKSDLFVFIISSDSLRRPNFLFELGAALGGGKRVVAVVPEDLDVSHLPAPIRERRYLLKRTPEETARELVADTAELAPGTPTDG